MWGVFNVVCAALTQLNAKCLKQSYHSFLKTREAFNFTTLSQTFKCFIAELEPTRFQSDCDRIFKILNALIFNSIAFALLS